MVTHPHDCRTLTLTLTSKTLFRPVCFIPCQVRFERLRCAAAKAGELAGLLGTARTEAEYAAFRSAQVRGALVCGVWLLACVCGAGWGGVALGGGRGVWRLNTQTGDMGHVLKFITQHTFYGEVIRTLCGAGLFDCHNRQLLIAPGYICTSWVCIDMACT